MHLDLTAFLNHLTTTNRSPLTVRRYGDVLRDLETFTDGAEPTSLTTEILRRFASAPCTDGTARAPAGVNLRVAVVKGAFRFLVDEREYAKDPARRVVGVRLPRRTPKHLTTAEMLRLAEHVAQEPESLRLRDAALVTLFWQRGLRVAEAAGLCVAQLDREARRIHDVRVKGGHVQDKVLNDETIVAIDRYLATRGELPGDAPIFATREGVRLSVRAIEARFERWRSELGWTRPLHPHLLRHTFSTELLERGAAIAVVAELLGHSGVGTVMIYASVLQPALQAAVATLGPLVPRSILGPVGAGPTPSDSPSPASRVAPPAGTPANDTVLTDFPCDEDQFYAAA